MDSNMQIKADPMASPRVPRMMATTRIPHATPASSKIVPGPLNQIKGRRRTNWNPCHHPDDL